MSEERIPLPEEYRNRQAAEEQRAADVAKVRGMLEQEQRKAAEEDPYGHWKTRIPADVIGQLGAQELEQLNAHEQAAFARHKPIAQERQAKRRAYVAAGGSEADFDRYWREHGEQAYIAERAERIDAGAQATSPY